MTASLSLFSATADDFGARARSNPEVPGGLNASAAGPGAHIHRKANGDAKTQEKKAISDESVFKRGRLLNKG